MLQGTAVQTHFVQMVHRVAFLTLELLDTRVSGLRRLAATKEAF